jgi:hypothetical protein
MGGMEAPVLDKQIKIDIDGVDNESFFEPSVEMELPRNHFEIFTDEAEYVTQDTPQMVYVSTEALQKAYDHCYEDRFWDPDTGHNIETGGALVGYFATSPDTNMRVLNVVDYIPNDYARGTVGEYTITSQAWVHLDSKLNHYNNIRLAKDPSLPRLKTIGWLHCHPDDYPPAPSGRDKFIMEHFFGNKYCLTAILGRGGNVDEQIALYWWDKGSDDKQAGSPSMYKGFSIYDDRINERGYPDETDLRRFKLFGAKNDHAELDSPFYIEHSPQDGWEHQGDLDIKFEEEIVTDDKSHGDQIPVEILDDGTVVEKKELENDLGETKNDIQEPPVPDDDPIPDPVVSKSNPKKDNKEDPDIESKPDVSPPKVDVELKDQGWKDKLEEEKTPFDYEDLYNFDYDLYPYGFDLMAYTYDLGVPVIPYSLYGFNNSIADMWLYNGGSIWSEPVGLLYSDPLFIPSYSWVGSHSTSLFPRFNPYASSMWYRNSSISGMYTANLWSSLFY